MAETYFDKEDTAFVYDEDTGSMFRLDGDKRVPVKDGDTMAKVLLRSRKISVEYAARLARIPFFEDAGS